MTIFTDYESTKQETQSFKKIGRLLAIDVGTKRLGLALSDASRFIATPKLILNRQSNEKDFAKIKYFISENEVIAIVVGRPINMDGALGEMTVFTEKFAQSLDEFLEKKFMIFLFEERLTSFEAKQTHASDLSRKKNKYVDDIAASFILQHFLESFC
jgi:putative Holliday junction resolvase